MKTSFLRLSFVGSAVVVLTASLPARSQAVLTDPTIYNYAQKEFPSDNTIFWPSFLFDNNTSTFYASVDQGVNTFVDFDYSSPTEITGFDMTQRDDVSRVLQSALIFSNHSDFSSSIASSVLNHTDSSPGLQYLLVY